MAHQFPAVLITGARQTGKTSLLRHLFPEASYLTMDLPANVETARSSPETLLDRFREPIIIDEIQYEPTLLKHIKVRIDSDRRPGRFYLTCSQVFGLMEGVSESLAGFRSEEELFASSHARAFWEAHVFSEIRKLFKTRVKESPSTIGGQ
jgi:predicted AAA+ superfamily ATPase